MAAPAHAMATGISVIQCRTISSLRRTGTGWYLDALEGLIGQPSAGFDAVVLALPSPQAQPILATANVRLADIDTPTYSSCWTLMAAFDEPLAGLPERSRLNDGPLSWVALNCSKPGRNARPACYVAQARPEWSKAHLELTPPAASKELRAALLHLASPATTAPLHAVAHRWRIALVEQAINRHYLWDADARIDACGDWCLGPRIEAAFLSGLPLGRTIAAQSK
jgi:renalase